MSSVVLADSEGHTPLEVLDGAALRRWAFRAEAALHKHRVRLDSLNVFPVPDGDTGTNLYLTLHSALESLVGTYLSVAHGTIVDGTQALVQHTLLSARGNSGVILSQLVRGMAEAVAAGGSSGQLVVDAPLMARVFRSASESARRAVSVPVEGTILTVADAAADGAEAALWRGASMVELTAAALASARLALAQTPLLLPMLAQAGVVDSGGAGFVVLLEALHEVVSGIRVSEGDDDTVVWGPLSSDVGAEAVEAGGAYEVMYLLEGCSAQDAERLRADLMEMGDSVLVVGDTDLRTIHAHVDDAGGAVEAGLGLGRVYAVRITWLGEDPAAMAYLSAAGSCLAPPAVPELPHAAGAELAVPAEPEPTPPGQPREIGLVACTPGAGLAALLTEFGAEVVRSAPGERATPRDIIEAIVRTGCSSVIVLPNDEDAELAAEAAAQLTGRQGIAARVIPTVSPIQGIVAAAVLQANDPLEPNLERMSEAAGLVRTGRVVVASRAAPTEAGSCETGDVLGFVGDQVALIGADTSDVGLDLVRRLGGADAELVTLVAGAGAGGLAGAVADRVRQTWPDLEVTCIEGGQPVDALLVGVE